MNKIYLLICLAFPHISIAQSHQIIAGQRTNVRYTDLVPDFYLNCNPPAFSETCGPTSYNLDLNGDLINDYKLEVYHSGLNDVSYTIYTISPYGNNMVLADTFSYFSFGSTNIYQRTMPIDSGKIISDAGLDLPDSAFVQYTNQLGFPGDSIHHFNRHFVFKDTVNQAYSSFFLNIPTVGMFSSMWQNNDASKLFAGLKFFTSTDTLYGWLQISPYGAYYYADYACTGDTASFTITSIKLEELKTKNQLKLFPNPTTDKLEVNLINLTEDVTSLKLVDISGKELRSVSTKKEKETLDVRNLENGVYLLIMKNSNTSESQKVIIAR